MLQTIKIFMFSENKKLNFSLLNVSLDFITFIFKKLKLYTLRLSCYVVFYCH